MKNFLTIFRLSIFSILFMSCSTYYLSSYYEEDGIYVSSDRVVNYKGVFSDLAQVSIEDFSSIDNRNLPWGAKPDSREIVYNFFPSSARFYYNPFFYDSYMFGLGHSFYPRPIEFYLNPYSYSIGNYYWYYYRNSRMYPWFNGGIYNPGFYERSYTNTSDTQIFRQIPTTSNSASRRGEKIHSNEKSRSTNLNGVRVSSIYSRSDSYQTDYNESTVIDNDRINSPNLTHLKKDNLIGIYRRGSGYSRNTNQIRYIPNLSAIKDDVIRETYQRIRSVNPSQRGSTFQGRSSENDSGRFQRSQNYYNSNSERSMNSSYSSSRSSSGSNFRSGSSSNQGVSRSSNVGSRGASGSRASAVGSRGGSGKIQ
ncbi:MAG: hypothetical protein ISQ43_02770 [Flavobacteriaceae bacterium]|nr:hypothetical protein [Cryomorphaceae bacterium]MBL6677745.1 hypothetical protein [Flavobacteriaceae bacterium]MDA1225619.1 hypothetical protein [Bacteroidota bacterium]